MSCFMFSFCCLTCVRQSRYRPDASASLTQIKAPISPQRCSSPRPLQFVSSLLFSYILPCGLAGHKAV